VAEIDAAPPASKLKSIASGPIFNSLLAIFGIAVTLAIWWLGRSTIDPVYRTYPVEVLAKKESSRLTVLWDQMPIETLCTTKIALLNLGSEPIGSARFTTTDPIRVFTSSNVRLLAVELAHVARPTLRVQATIANDKRGFDFSLLGGDAFENGEGIAFRLLFTGDCSGASFVVRGRVIGTVDGFRPRARIEESLSVAAMSFFVFLLCFFSFLVVSFFYFAERIGDLAVNRWTKWRGACGYPLALRMTIVIAIAPAYMLALRKLFVGLIMWRDSEISPWWLP